ncbi:7-cyano-7-deazaguanine synthase [Leeuwenhoekiella sp. LLG6367-2.1]|uniref:7-cyano-7-deazaguanine synthase n=1 Tax=Leeuwenhoekiella sp. LLG6367-2.1 TaxID=3160833 RepID=UPI003870CD84
MNIFRQEFLETLVLRLILALKLGEIIPLANKLKVDIKKTISCYQPLQNKECGQCISCLVNYNALINN